MQIQSKFGKQRLDDFLIDKTFINLNHGSYGYTPKTVLAHKQKLLEQMEFNTQKWFRNDLEILINETRSYIAKKVNASKQNIFMAENATDAFNGLVKSIHWKQGDVVLLPNTAYASIRKTMQWIRDYWKIQILIVDFSYEDLQTSQSIQLKIQDTVNMFPKRIKLAIFDHISSMPSIIWPIHAIQLFLEQKGIDLFVDGAHAICQEDIDISNLNCQAYFSNLHKWAFTPKNAAFVYVSNKYLDIIRPTITGNFRGQGIARQYFWTGTRDCTAYICAQKGIEYLQSFGPNEVRRYNQNIAMTGAKLMASIWKTRLFSEDQDLSGFMVSVILPTNDIEIASQALKELLQKHNAYIAVSEFKGKVYCRICGQIYNELQDYRKVAELFLQLIQKKQQ